MARHRTSTSAHPRLWAGVGAMLLGIAVVGIAYPMWWDHHSSTAGHVLLQRTRFASAVLSGRGTIVASCRIKAADAAAVPSRQQPGVLHIPAIGLTAPVLEGLSNSVLDVAVGHDPVTVWPGGLGESLLLAHDVSYFSGLARVRPGDAVIWTLGCERAVFRIIATSVTHPGSALSAPSSGYGLALITCWPTNALFWTPDRYVVETELISRQSLAHPATTLPPSLADLKVSAPPALAAEGLSVEKSGVRVGHLAISGSPSSAFREGPEPLAAAAAALREYVAVVKTTVAGNRSWWSALAVPGVPLPHPWSLAYDTNVTLVVKEGTVKGVVLSSAAASVTMAVHHGVLFVVGVDSRRYCVSPPEVIALWILRAIPRTAAGRGHCVGEVLTEDGMSIRGAGA